ncbi:MAG: FAD:protein FMN transferase [Clostridia bacterium]|nr:FAD:protein FMN transferase [Clostridia bacterium]
MKRSILLVAISLFICMLFTSCGRAYKEESFFCMDTVATVKVDTSDVNIINRCRELLDNLDKELSRHNINGKTAEFNASLKGGELSENILELIYISQNITKQTDGTFSVFSGALTSLWSEAAVYPSSEKIKNAVDSIDFEPKINGNILEKNNADTKLEFGGIAKGYACDKAIELLKNDGVSSGMVSFSSSIGVIGKNPDGNSWRIAVKNPIDTDKILGYISLEDGFLSVSGDYERHYEIDGEKYNHIIDIKSGLPVNHGIHSVVVVAKSGALCDALSTAFFVMGEEAVAEKYADSLSVQYLIVSDNGIFINESMKKIYTKAE